MYKIIPAAYIFTHQYLNTMQQGIQSLHVVGEFMAKYQKEDQAFKDSVMNWATNDKTVRILNAGVGGDFFDAKNDAERLARVNGLPFAEFLEPDISCMTTAFGLIVTPDIVMVVDEHRERIMLENSQSFTEDDLDSFPLVEFLKKFPSAR